MSSATSAAKTVSPIGVDSRGLRILRDLGWIADGPLVLFMPASLGTVVMLLMFVAIIPGATLAEVTAAFAVEKIFFAVVNAFVYVYLFVAVPAWNVVFAALLVLLVFGWTNGRALKSSYAEAKERARQRRKNGTAPTAHAELGQG